MNRTSPGLRLVRMAAKSPGRSSTGPEVERMLTPSSAAMMCARVVFPSPGGPYSSTWSSASVRCLAAVMKISSRSLRLVCPTYSCSRRGRNCTSAERSSSVETGVSKSRGGTRMSRAFLLAQEAQSVAEQILQGRRLLRLCGVQHLPHGALSDDPRIAEILQRRHGIGDHLLSVAPRSQAIPQFGLALGEFLA